MSLDAPLADFEIGSGAHRGAHLTLYANRLLYQGSDAMETVPLAQLAAVRVAFARDARKLKWAIGLLIIALILAAISGPLQGWITSLAAGVRDNARREALDAVLLGTFSALRQFAGLLPLLAAALAAGAVALLIFFWLGVTELTLAFGATERSYAVWGRNRFLHDFALSVADQIAQRKA